MSISSSLEETEKEDEVDLSPKSIILGFMIIEQRKIVTMDELGKF